MDAGCSNSGKGGQQYPTQGIAQRLSETMLQWLYDKLAIVVIHLDPINMRLFDFDHCDDSSSSK